MVLWLSATVLPYSGKLSREKLSWIGRKGAFCRETDHIMGVACLNFVEKTFVSGCKIRKFVKVFSLESFLL